jgi:hypothetical protein
MTALSEKGGNRVPHPCILGALPTVLRSGPYRIFFYSADRDEPPYIHVEREDSEANVWLDPVRLERSGASDARKFIASNISYRNKAPLLLREWHVLRKEATATRVSVSDDTLTADLADGRTISG